MSLLSKIHDRCGVHLAFDDLFEDPSCEALAARIAQGSSTAQARIEPAPIRASYPLHPTQARFFFLQSIDPLSTAYNLPHGVYTPTTLDQERVASAAQALLVRHAVLGASCRIEQGQPVLIPPAPGATLALERATVEHERDIAGAMDAFVRPFDLSRGPLLRVCLVEVANGGTGLLFDIHHIAADGLSLLTLITEFLGSYREQPLPEAVLQFHDVAVAHASRPPSDRARAYWLSTYDELPEVLDLPLDRERPPQRTNAADTVRFELESSLVASLRALAGQHGVTLPSVLMTGFAWTLMRHSDQREIVIGTPVANRTRPELQRVVGPFVNTLALRIALRDDQLAHEAIASVHQTMRQALLHQEYPFEALVEALDVPRVPSRHALFDVMCSFAGMDFDSLDDDTMQWSSVQAPVRHTPL